MFARYKFALIGANLCSNRLLNLDGWRYKPKTYKK